VYSIETDDEALAQVATLPVVALSAFAEPMPLREIAPWSAESPSGGCYGPADAADGWPIGRAVGAAADQSTPTAGGTGGLDGTIVDQPVAKTSTAVRARATAASRSMRSAEPPRQAAANPGSWLAAPPASRPT